MHKYLSLNARTSMLQIHRSEKNRKKDGSIKTVLLADDDWNYRQIARALFIDKETDQELY